MKVPLSAVTRAMCTLAATVLVVSLLLGLVSSLGGAVEPSKVVLGVRKALPAFVAVYVLCQVVQTLFRAQRARVLLRASCPSGAEVPGLARMSLVTFVRNACADMLPARIGELSYVAMLNGGYAIPAADCLSSLSVGLLFDFIALLMVLAVAAPAAANGLSLLGSILLLAVVCLVGVVCLYALLPLLARWAARLRGANRLFRWKPVDALFGLFLDAAYSVSKTRKGGILLPTVLLSIGVRAAKYAGLYGLFLAVTRPLWPELSHASVFAVLTALIAAEGAASLPVPTFLSFGTYEAGGLAALTALGFPASDSVTAMFAMHLLSQIIDYSIGGIAYLVFLWTGKAEAKSPKPVTSDSRLRSTRSRAQELFRFTGALFFLFLVLAFSALQYRKMLKHGRLSAPPCGEAVPVSAEDAAARDAALAGFLGRVVWSSNREGLHDLYLMTLPGGEVRRLTTSDFTDTYPRFSPDGTKVAFSRSTERWVSQRNGILWDTWVLDLASGSEWRVATNAFMAVWSPDGESVVFQRNCGETIVRASAAPNSDVGEEELLRSGVGGIPAGALMTLPAVREGDPWLAVTLRGRGPGRDCTAHVWCDGHVSRIAGGCQMVWRRLGGDAYVWVDHPGNMKNAIRAASLGTPEASVLFDEPGDYSHEYFPAFTADGRWLAYGASTGGHEQDSEDYEIFLLDTSRDSLVPARLTFHTGNDCWPDVRED